ncbi:DUF262 domain-containing protein [Corynebacterium glutamicum]|uniref:DUF262 domain-containing protein n=2 Tax=Corynebacteriaceae TaxID=1653 RepID=UPI0007202460|nr:DUF262 domain-containing protein [Corynebacterium glutamicum]ALP48816.1 hypothetical protein AC079_00395 [Corynebacterium glutamicum]ANU32348.1 hypothetical protein BBD29_00390 [Corynebacterium glutamicum]APT06093.1 hypothetical protein BSP99_00415 [Corynebacterium glutamicum]QWQ83008.1 hypothetical protein B5C28_00390 [Corynebacterium glutamicum]WFP71833.1 DUF262 domain-containing protein [Corynebacterium glutamicum]
MIKSLNNDPIHILFSHDNNVVYQVPKFQREYTWGKAEWDELIDDLIENDNGEGHFLGTIICVNSTSNTTQESILELIDGQQRLTTISLLLVAIYTVLNDRRDALDEDDVVDLINLKRMLVLRNPSRSRLRPQSQGLNDADYTHVLAIAGLGVEDPQPSYSGNRRIKKAYKHFIGRIEQHADLQGWPVERAALDFLARAKRTHLVKLEVISHADAFTLFESLNNRGVPLTPIDLIKNTLLAQAERTPGTNLDDAYDQWREWLTLLGDDYKTQERFFRYFYMAMRGESDIAVPGITVATKSNLIRIYEELITRDVKTLMSRLTEGVHAFSQLLGQGPDTADIPLKNSFTRLRRSQGLSAHILLLYLLINQDDIELSDQELIEIVDLQTAFSVRRNLTGKPATYSLVRLYMDLVSKLRNADPSERKDIILAELTAVSATDENFHSALTGSVYDLNADIVRFILTSLAEQSMTRETEQDLWRRTGAGSSSTYVWSIEHILPQGENLPDEWVDMLGGAEQAAHTQQNYKHYLGNLTITGYNSSLSNAGFIKKRDRTDQQGRPIGYRNRLSLNSDLAEREEWGAAEILSRTESLAKQTMRAFPLQYPSDHP